jgi:hypothetical protein
MNGFWKIKKKQSVTPADIKLEQIKNILFPPMELLEEPDPEGNMIKFHVDYSADSNLEAALSDLQDGHNDSQTQQTINTITNKLFEVRKIMEAYANLNEDAKYIVVDMKNEDISLSIEAKEENDF